MEFAPYCFGHHRTGINKTIASRVLLNLNGYEPTNEFTITHERMLAINDRRPCMTLCTESVTNERMLAITDRRPDHQILAIGDGLATAVHEHLKSLQSDARLR